MYYSSARCMERTNQRRKEGRNTLTSDKSIIRYAKEESLAAQNVTFGGCCEAATSGLGTTSCLTLRTCTL